MDHKKVKALCKSILWCIYILMFPVLSGTLSAVLSFGAIETLYLQGMFMLLSLAIPVILIFMKKMGLE